MCLKPHSADSKWRKIMHNISFSDGMEEIMINNDPERVIRWNPTDSNFNTRFFKFQDYVKDLHNELMTLTKNIEAIASEESEDSEMAESKARDTMAQITQLGVELSEMLDMTFNAPVSKIAFRGANPLSPTRDGSFIFDNFLRAIAPIVTESVEEASKAAEARVKKYTEPVKKSTRQ